LGGERRQNMRNLITGGAGFVGANLAAALLDHGEEVVVLDNLSRKGTEHNLSWLQRLRRPGFQFVNGDVRDMSVLKNVFHGVDAVFHLAAQVAVTTSIEDPRSDFETNALGSLNVLENVRAQTNPPVAVFTSTNKVYGGLEGVAVVEDNGRYVIPSLPEGIPEDMLLDFHSPYGCSKGSADQYFRDYARIYQLPTVVFRMSCIYGPHQFGNEDQGWVMHFVASCLKKHHVTIYGDGKQVRDILHVDDLVRAFLCARESARDTPGLVLNIGGGPQNALPIRDVLRIAEQRGTPPSSISHGPWRWGDQKVYISCIKKAASCLNWEPKISCQEGIDQVFTWARDNLELFP
jgi:CDP-paratose 2-epimerase